MPSTTSIRMPDNLKNRLENAAKRLSRGKNWIITSALEEYLNKIDRESLSMEARRQLDNVRESDASDDWEEYADWDNAK